MSNAWKVRLDGALREGEVVGLYFTTAMLIVVEFCFVYWLHQIQIPEAASNAASGFIVDAAVVPKAAIRSDAAAHDPGGSVVFGVLGTLGVCGAREPTRGRGRRPFNRSNSGCRRRRPWRR